MLQNCTILRPTDETARVVTQVRGSFGSRGLITVDTEAEGWSSITLISSIYPEIWTPMRLTT
jgi:hypothetical protein